MDLCLFKKKKRFIFPEGHKSRYLFTEETAKKFLFDTATSFKEDTSKNTNKISLIFFIRKRKLKSSFFVRVLQMLSTKYALCFSIHTQNFYSNIYIKRLRNK